MYTKSSGLSGSNYTVPVHLRIARVAKEVLQSSPLQPAAAAAGLPLDRLLMPSEIGIARLSKRP